MESLGLLMDRLEPVQISEVRKVFGRHPALGGVSCTLRAGELSLLAGPNGAGKSTLLSILATLSRPTSGQVLYGGQSRAHVEDHLRGRIGLLAHAPMLYGQISGRENLLFFARLYGVPDPFAAVDCWLERVGLAQVAGRPVRQLSRGMVQRLSLARALLHDPELLLLDEPFSGLDRQGRDLLCKELRAALQAGKVVVMVSHEIEALDGLCDHLVVLRQGRLAADVQEPGMSAARTRELYHGAL